MVSFTKWIRSWFAYFSDRNQFAQFFALSEKDFPTLEEYCNNPAEYGNNIEDERKLVTAIQRWWQKKVTCFDFKKYPASILRKYEEHITTLYTDLKDKVLRDTKAVCFKSISRNNGYRLLLVVDIEERITQGLNNLIYFIEKEYPNMVQFSDPKTSLIRMKYFKQIHTLKGLFEFAFANPDEIAHMEKLEELYRAFQEFTVSSLAVNMKKLPELHQKLKELMKIREGNFETQVERDVLARDEQHHEESQPATTPDATMQVEGDNQHNEANQATTPGKKMNVDKVQTYQKLLAKQGPATDV